MKNGLKKWRFLPLVAAMAFILSGCGEPFLSTLQPAGEVAQKQFNLMMLSVAIMVLVIIVVAIVYVIAVTKFRRSKLGEDFIPKQVEGSHRLEVIWTVIPIILLLILAVPTVALTFELGDQSGMEAEDEEGNREALVVDVRANLYWWEFAYPDQGIVTAQDLVVPTDQNVYFNVIASDVKHSFWIPAVGGKIDTNVDNMNTFYLNFDGEKAEEANNLFYGKCAELCGPSHALMDFKVQTMSQEDFDSWVASMQEVAEAEQEFENETIARGAELYNDNQLGCIGCHAVDPTQQIGTSRGPNMANFGERSYTAGILDNEDSDEVREENIKNWIRNSAELKPGNQMPVYNEDDLSDEDLDALTEYLMSLKVFSE
ncbi:cytochrome c oxidase subunit II [Jeotgalibacillus haloalkalitolerans]|uniref:Cytochrome c oxidase subunit 2 n=1 Tax=Jeotgalibacillus haloalkalitolerans TaxID=3104292 RepID=A0ABU5KK37_9BACL|nr:cytochrome c oxidase subunit II [Jeotgalibacillus sp. HH7-29]MDZ5711527.1 cytochrome c oxidase subunit II [Jeotgalibacillus sp. HH7-29]